MRFLPENGLTTNRPDGAVTGGGAVPTLRSSHAVPADRRVQPARGSLPCYHLLDAVTQPGVKHLRSPCVTGRDSAPRFLPSSDADGVEGAADEQRQEQRATGYNKAHAYSPSEMAFQGHLAHPNPTGALLLPVPVFAAGAGASDDDQAGDGDPGGLVATAAAWS